MSLATLPWSVAAWLGFVAPSPEEPASPEASAEPASPEPPATVAPRPAPSEPEPPPPAADRYPYPTDWHITPQPIRRGVTIEAVAGPLLCARDFCEGFRVGGFAGLAAGI